MYVGGSKIIHSGESEDGRHARSEGANGVDVVGMRENGIIRAVCSALLTALRINNVVSPISHRDAAPESSLPPRTAFVAFPAMKLRSRDNKGRRCSSIFSSSSSSPSYTVVVVFYTKNRSGKPTARAPGHLLLPRTMGRRTGAKEAQQSREGRREGRREAAPRARGLRK